LISHDMPAAAQGSSSLWVCTVINAIKLDAVRWSQRSSITSRPCCRKERIFLQMVVCVVE
jgi:hypothetical protein